MRLFLAFYFKRQPKQIRKTILLFNCKIVYKKLLPHKTWDKRNFSCGTTQIGLFGPLEYMHFMHVPLITGRTPVGSY